MSLFPRQRLKIVEHHGIIKQGGNGVVGLNGAIFTLFEQQQTPYSSAID
jgi:hypothetical protein